MRTQYMQLFVALATCQSHVSAFASIGRATSGPLSAGTAALAGHRLTSPVPVNIDGPDHLVVLHRARGGQLFNRKAVSVPQEASQQRKQDNDDMFIDTQGPVEKKGLLNAYLRALDTRPILTKVITSGVICGIGDIMAQGMAYSQAAGTVTLGAMAAALEMQRFLIYSVLGAFWIAPIVHYWFDAIENVTMSPQGPPKTFAGRMGKALKMVTLDQTIGAPIVNAGMMFLFTFLSAVVAGGFGAAPSKKAGLMVRHNLWSTMTVCWKVWPIANLINFAFVPANLRVLFMNLVGIGWNIFLSAAVN